MYTCSGLLAVLFVGEKDEKEIDKRIDEITNVIEKIQRELKIKITFDPIHSAHKNEFFYNKNGAQMSFKLLPGVKVPKGLTITAELEGLDGATEKPRYVVYCDGSRRINFEDIFTVFSHLHLHDHDCVITKRIPWRGAISEPRKKIEEFESWLTCTQFGILGKVHDLQSGLWGYNYERCKVKIHSEGYEVELNFATEAFKIAKNISEIEIHVNTEASSTSASLFVEDYSESSFHYQKAFFLSQYFLFNSSQLIKKIKEYQDSRDKSFHLPPEYFAMIGLLDKPSQPPNIVST